MNRKQTETCTAYVARLRSVLKELGCRPTTMCHYQYQLETRVGLLLVSVYSNQVLPGAWVATMFDEPRRAIKLLGHGSVNDPNPYTGKWNHYFFEDEHSLDAAEGQLRQAFTRVLEVKQP